MIILIDCEAILVNIELIFELKTTILAVEDPINVIAMAVLEL